MAGNKTRILFFAEGATLAHVGRPFLLAKALDPTRYEVVFARPQAYSWLTHNAGFQVIDLQCQYSRIFSRRLERGSPLYDLATLERYVEADFALIDELKPDVVIGDFRLSLSVSARVRQVPYITICDAYWSPEFPLEPTLPVTELTSHIPLPLAERVFRVVAPLVFRLHARPLEILRKRHGLPSLGYDLRYCYTDADLRLFANFPALFPETPITGNAGFLGPIAWSPADRADLRLPGGDGPLVYVTMGSSGDPQVLSALIPSLEAMGARVMVASAGKALPSGIISEKTFVSEFLPGEQLCRLARLVVCNGGSPTTNQALTHGIPVLGIARNMDQFLNMRAIERFGAGLTLRSDRLGQGQPDAALEHLLSDRKFSERADSLAHCKMPDKILEQHIRILLEVRRV